MSPDELAALRPGDKVRLFGPMGEVRSVMRVDLHRAVRRGGAAAMLTSPGSGYGGWYTASQLHERIEP